MQTWAQVLTRAWSGYVIQRCHNKNLREKIWPGMWVTSRTRIVRRDLRKVRVEFLPQKKTVDFQSSPRLCGGCRTWWGADGKVVIERLCLSLPHVKKPFNSKVIKSFVPELRSRKCFLCFRIPMLSIYELWTFYVRFTHPYIWLCNTGSDGNEWVLLSGKKLPWMSHTVKPLFIFPTITANMKPNFPSFNIFLVILTTNQTF